MNNPTLPAGIENKAVEIYVADDELKATYQGTVIPFIELPENLREVFEVELIKYKVAFKTIQQVFNICDSMEMLEQFVKCRYGGFDYTPDITQGKLETNPEYWDCGHRSKCLAEGKVCILPQAVNGRLTPREVEVVRLVAQGLPDKLISDKLGIALCSVVTYQKRIREKLGVYSRIDIMKFAMQNNLVQ